MEGRLTWEYNTLISELTQGMENANQLRFHLSSSTCPPHARDLLLQRILASYEKALMILRPQGGPAASAAPESSISADGSPKSEDFNKHFTDHQDYSASKKRKLQPTWTEQVRVSCENGLEGPIDDGYSWRKYGQKDILGAKYPRSYYRCTYRLVQNCWATKQVQRSDEDATVFEITYKGTHTCNQSTTTATPEKQEAKHHHQQFNPTLTNFKTNLRVATENLGQNETQNLFSFPSTYAEGESHYFPISAVVDDSQFLSYSSVFLSPETPESNYFSPATFQMKNFGGANIYQHSESDVGEIISGHASTTNSPIGGMEFPADNVDLDTNFPFNAPGLF